MRTRRLLIAYGLLLVAGAASAADCIVGTKPTRGTPCTDPQTGNTVNRATVHSTDQPGSTKMLGDYSKRQAFNSDNSYYMIRADSGFWCVFTTATHLPKNCPATGVAGEPDFIWNPTNPDKGWYMDNNGGLKLYEYTVSTDTHATVADLTTRCQAIWPTCARLNTGAEGSPSKDGRYWGWNALTSGFGMLGFLVYDLQTDTVVATLSTTSGPPNWVGMSPTGDYFMVAYVNELGPEGQIGRVRAYTRDLTSWTRVSCWIGHDDVLLGPNGHDYYVSAQTAGCDPDGKYNYVDLVSDFVASGDATRHKLSYGVYDDGAYNSFHISGKAFDRPGVFLVSTDACSSGSCPNSLSDRLILFNIDNSPPQILGNTFDVYESYWTEVFGTISRDGTKVLWNSNWDKGGTPDGDVEAYIVDLPSAAFTITTTTMANCTSGQACTRDAQTAGGTQPPTSCTTSAGALPSNMSWSVVGSACRLSGTHTGAGTFNFTLEATDSAAQTDTQAFELIYNSTLQIDTTSPMPNGVLNSSYSTCFACSGGTPPCTWTKLSGSEPTGLTLGSNGCFTGNATQLGTFNTLNVRATDTLSATADGGPYSITVQEATLTMGTPIILPLATSVNVQIGALGLPYENDCQATLRDNGSAVIEVKTSSSGYARRSFFFTGLTAATTYSLILTCDGATPSQTPYPFATKPTPSGGNRTVSISAGAPVNLPTAVRATVEYDDNEAMSTPASVQNTSCASGCTINLSIAAGQWWYRWIWQTSGDVTVAAGPVQPLQVQ